MNSVQLIGTLARAPVVRFEGDGIQTCTFTLSVQETSAGGKAFRLFAPCIAYGRSAEAASLLAAEDLVSVQGKLGWHKRKAKCGEEHSQLVVAVREVQALQGAAGADHPTGRVGQGDTHPGNVTVGASGGGDGRMAPTRGAWTLD